MSLNIGLSHVYKWVLPSWGAHDNYNKWLNMLSVTAQDLLQWRKCIHSLSSRSWIPLFFRTQLSIIFQPISSILYLCHYLSYYILSPLLFILLFFISSYLYSLATLTGVHLIKLLLWLWLTTFICRYRTSFSKISLVDSWLRWGRSNYSSSAVKKHFRPSYL